MATYPSRTRPFQLLPLLFILLWLVPACGSSPSAPDTTTPPPSTTPQTTAVTYSGTYQSSNGSYGSITVTAQVPVAILSSVTTAAQPKAIVSAVGTLKPAGGGASVALIGTYDTVTGKFTMTGGNYTISATVTPAADGNVLNGSVTTPTTQGTVVALTPPATGTIITYCGNFVGGSSGTLVVTRRDNKLMALVAENGEPAPFSIPGTLTGTAVDLSFNWTPPGVGRTNVTGTLNGGIMSGTWNNTDKQSGTWEVRAGSCPL